MGIGFHPLLRVGDLHVPEHVGGQTPCLPLFHPIHHQTLGDLASDGIDRVKGVQGILEDHADLPAPHLAHLFGAQLQQIPALEADLPAGDAPRRTDEPQNGPGGGGFSAAGFPHQGEGLAPAQVEADVGDRLHPAGEGDRQVVYL